MPGWRLGWLFVPRDMVERARSYLGCLFLTAPTISQHVALAAMDCTAELEANRAAYAANRALLLAALPGMGLSHTAPPCGAFYIYGGIQTGKALLRDVFFQYVLFLRFDVTIKRKNNKREQ